MKKYYLLLFCNLILASLNAQQLNDECGTATFLGTISEYCSGETEFNNNLATESADVRPACWSDSSRDVWFTFIPTQPAALVTIFGMEATGDGKLNDPAIAIYQGPCNNLTELACQERDAGVNIIEQFVDNLIIGEIYYLRVNARLGGIGNFQLCVETFIPVPTPESDCPDAVVLCDKTPFLVESLQGFGIEELASVPNACFNGNGPLTESSSSWYKWTCEDSGSLTFTLTPNNNPPGAESDDLDFLLFRLPGGLDDCNNKELVRCMLSGANTGPGTTFADWENCNGPTGLMIGDGDTEEFNGCQNDIGNNNFVEAIDMISGESYALIIMNFTDSGQGFEIEFGGTGTFVGPDPDFEATLPTVEQIFECDKTILFEDLSSSETDPIVEWVWNFGVGADIPVAVGPGPHSIIYESFGSKTVALTVTSSRGCQVTKIIDLEVEPCCADISTLGIEAFPTDIDCAGEQTGELELTGIQGDPQYLYSVNGGQFLPNALYNGLPAGEYTITVQDIKGCEETTIVTILEPPPIIITTSGNQEIDLGTSTDISASATDGTGTLTYMWIPCDEGLSCCDCPDPEVFPSDDVNVYTVIVTDENNCEVRQDLTITTIFEPTFFAPNIFSPNGDGVNEFFNAFAGIEAEPTFELSVFDRWGNMVYENNALAFNDINIGWDGRFNNRDATEGVYTWLATVTYINNQIINYTGDVTVVRE